MSSATHEANLIGIIDGQVCLSSEAMKQIGLTQYAIWHGTGGHWATITDPSDARRKWVVYESLPPVTKRKVDRYYGDLKAKTLGTLLVGKVNEHLQTDDANFFTDLFNVEQISDLVRACAWLRYLSSNERLEMQTTVGGWHKLLTLSVDQLQQRRYYGLRVKNIRVLDRKVRAWKESMHSSLVNGRHGLTNASKADVSVLQKLTAWLVAAYGQPTKPDTTDVYYSYLQEAAQRNWPVYSLERVRQIIQEPANRAAWMAARHGNRHANEILLPTVRRRPIETPDTLWSIDGTSVQLYSQGYDKKGRSVPVKDWYYVLVLDVASGSIIGWAASPGAGEPAELVQRAIRRAVKTNGKAPRFAHYDHAGGNLSVETQQVWAALNTAGVAAQPYNGKAKHIESAIRWFEQKCLRAMPNFVGGNIGSGIDSQANPDLIKALLKTGNLPTKEQVLEQIQQAVDKYNSFLTNKKLGAPTRIERYMSTGDAGRLSKQAIASAFWVRRNSTYKYDTDGITIEVRGKRHLFVVEEKTGIDCPVFIKNHNGDRFIVRYDPDDLSSIMLYDTKTEVFVAEAANKYQFGAMPTEWKDNEGSTLSEIFKRREQQAEEQRQRFAELVAEADYETISLPTEAGLALLGTKNDYNESQAAAELDSLFLENGRSVAARLLGSSEE
jgi:hypothetical protein